MSIHEVRHMSKAKPFRCPHCQKEVKREPKESTSKFKALDGKKHKFLVVICPDCEQPLVRVND